MTQRARTDLTTGKGVTNLYGRLSLRQVRDLVRRTSDWPEESLVDWSNTRGSTLLVCRPESSSPIHGVETGPETASASTLGGSAGQSDSTAPPAGRPVGWYRTMEHPWATRHCGFPADPAEGAQWNADDGSGWTFDLTGTGWWEISRYAGDSRVAELESALQTAREMYTSARERAKHGHLGAAVKLLEYAMRLRMYGERAPGGDETWHEWATGAETFLRSLADITEEPTDG